MYFVCSDEEQVEEDIDDDTSSTGTMAPQVKIGPDGEIIIDQTSLYVEASPAKTFDPREGEVIHEDSSNTTYSSFMNRKRTAAWTEKGISPVLLFLKQSCWVWHFKDTICQMGLVDNV